MDRCHQGTTAPSPLTTEYMDRAPYLLQVFIFSNKLKGYVLACTYP